MINPLTIEAINERVTLGHRFFITPPNTGSCSYQIREGSAAEFHKASDSISRRATFCIWLFADSKDEADEIMRIIQSRQDELVKDCWSRPLGG